jgi:TatA/E family protein of Tat protein translocase
VRAAESVEQQEAWAPIMPFGIGPLELIIVLVIALLVLGPGKLPDVGAALGKSIREFRKAATEVEEATKVDLAPLPSTSTATPAPAPVAQASAPVAAPAAAPVAAAVGAPAVEPPAEPQG